MNDPVCSKQFSFPNGIAWHQVSADYMFRGGQGLFSGSQLLAIRAPYVIFGVSLTPSQLHIFTIAYTQGQDLFPQNFLVGWLLTDIAQCSNLLRIIAHCPHLLLVKGRQALFHDWQKFDLRSFRSWNTKSASWSSAVVYVVEHSLQDKESPGDPRWPNLLIFGHANHCKHAMLDSVNLLNARGLLE